MKKVSAKTNVDFSEKEKIQQQEADAKKTATKNIQITTLPIDNNTSACNLSGKEIMLTPLFDYIDTAIFIVDGHINLIDANRPFYSLCGYTKDEIDTAAAHHMFSQNNHLELMDDSKKTSAAWTILHKNGSKINITVSASLLPTASGTVYYMLTVQHILVDETTSVTPAPDENNFFSGIEHSLTALFLTRPNGQIVDANEAACEMFGYSIAELKHLGREGILNHNDVNYDLQLFNRKKQGRMKGILTGIKKNGIHFPIEVSSVLFKNENGEQYSTVSMTDISEWIKIQNDHLQLLNNTEESFVIVDRNLNIINFNKKFQTYCNHFLSKNPAKGDSILSYSAAEDIAGLKNIYEAVFKGEKKSTESDNDFNGVATSLHYQFKPLTDEHGNIFAAFVTSVDVTEKKKTLQQIISGKERYKALIDNGNEAVAIFSAEGTLQYISAAVNTVLGYTDEDMLQLSPLALAHPEDVADLEKTWQELVAHKDCIIQNYLCRMMHKNGSWRWTESNFHNLLHDASVEGIVNNFRDVTDRITAAEKIRQSEENLNAIFENSDQGFVLINPDFTVRSCNNIARYNVFTSGEIKVGDTILNYVDDNRKGFFKAILLSTLSGESFNYDLLTTNKQTKEALWVNINVNPVKLKSKVAGICLTGRDITKQKEKDLKIAQKENLLKRAEAITQTGSIEIDYLTNKRLWSDGFYRILDLEPGSIECSRENFIQFLHPDDKDTYLNAIDQQISNRQPSGPLEVRIITASGAEKNIKAYAQMTWSGDGKPLKMVGVLHDITQQKTEEKQKWRLKKLLNSAESLARIGSAEINMQTGKRIWSDEFYRIIGLEPGSIEPSREGIMQFIHPAEKSAYLQWLQQGLSNKIESQQIETRIITAKGEERAIMAYGSTKYNAAGNPDILIGVIQDITERKKMEQDLKESREMYQSLFYQNPAAVFSMDMDGYITSANNILAAKAECTMDELNNMHFTNFIFPEDLPAVKSYFENTKNGFTQEHEIRIITAKGNTLQISLVTLPILINNQITGVYCIAADITKEKNALTLLNKTLADRQRILDYSFDMICEIDAAGHFLQVSKACKKVLGYQPEELIGKRTIDFVAEADKQPTIEMEKQLAEKGIQINNFENNYVRKDGHIVSLSWTARWDKDEKTMYCIAKDATEKKAQEYALGLSEMRYQYLFNNNPLPLYIFDFKTHAIIEANPAAFKKYGYTKKEFLSLTIDGLRPPEEIPIMEKMLKSEAAFSNVNGRIWTHRKKNGELMYLKNTGNIIDYNGKQCVLCLLDDVTEKIKAEEATRESEEKRRLIMNAALDAVICMDLQGRITFWNPQAEKIFGWKETEAMGHNVSTLLIPERYRKLPQQGMDRYLKPGNSQPLRRVLNLHVVNKDLKEFPVEITIQSIKQKGEQFFCSFIRDVTEQRKADSLKNFERRDKEALINSTDDLIWSVSKDLKLIAGNKAFVKNFKKETGVLIKPGDYLLRKDAFSEDMLLIWHEMYYCALSGEAIKKEISSNSQNQVSAEWNEVSFNPIYNGREITGIACYSRNITENKLQKDKLLAINKKLETAQKMARLGYWEVDLKTGTAFWSDELYRIHRFENKGQPVPLQQIAGVIHPDDLKLVMQYYADAIEGKRLYDYEHRIVLNDGTIKVLLQKGTLVHNKEGVVIGLEGTTQDITLLKLAEQAVKDSEEKYRMIFNCNPLPNWIYDLETLQIMEVNDAAIAHYGYSSAEFLKMTIKQLFIAEQVPALIQVNQEINNYGLINFGQWQHVKKSGAPMDVDITGHSIFYSNRNAVMIVCNDITEIISAQQALVKSIERFEYATRATSDAIWDCDLANDTVFWGEGFNTLFGYKMKDPRPGLHSWESCIHPDEQAAVIQTMTDVIDDKEKNYWQGEYRFRKFDGTYANVADYALIIRDKNGKPYRIIGAMQDITKRIQNEIMLKELNQQLNKRAAELASSNAELEQFAYIASHDLQEPLRMVTSFLSQIQKKYEAQLDENGRIYIGFAVDGAVRMRKIIQDLLEYSRVGWQKYHFEKVDMNHLLKEVVSIYSNTIEQKKMLVSWNNLPEITGAKIPLQQLLQNLIGNAIKYQHPDTVPEITITAAAFDEYWEFAVADNGIGIDPEYFDRIFVIFQRLHNKNEFSGTGIGLAICKKIVNNHNGKLWVKSEQKKGSTFYFTIARQNLQTVASQVTTDAEK
ncbi:MAG: domain S-box [Ferruginibacter sp.]|uniref:PAS domain S-box protein n=1 Tax=Ferruginibacter sp. TaxID=1940288 RepID=UPI002658FE30|nr:PAS domain S-box protein [Ferruginibacter sp.]MDB5276677.1 domain S-box [Ferruginibacter sp.]